MLLGEQQSEECAFSGLAVFSRLCGAKIGKNRFAQGGMEEILCLLREANLSQILNKSIFYTNYQKCATNYQKL